MHSSSIFQLIALTAITLAVFFHGPLELNTNFLYNSAAPTAPRNVVTSGINATSIRVEWEEPETANGIIRGYNISHNLSESVMSVAGSVRAATFSDLSPFTWYLFTVIAFTIEAGPETNVSARTDEAG